MNKEIEVLIEQKREIERRINELKGCEIEQGSVRYSIRHYPTTRPDEYCISSAFTKTDGGKRNNVILIGLSKSEVADKIPALIADLQKLYERLKENDT